MQAKLLTALDPHRARSGITWRITRVGGSRVQEIDARIVLGTNRDLPRAAAEGAFRIDLLGRIAMRSVVLPPLRQQRHTIPGAYLDVLEEEGRTYTADKQKPLRFTFHRDALQALVAFAFAPESTWPWNHRDVEHSARRLAFASWTDLKDSRGETIFITREQVSAELDRVRASWKALSAGHEVERPWPELEQELGADKAAKLTLLEGEEATWLLRALAATNQNRAAAWRWLVERNVYAPEGEPNPSAAFGVRWKRAFPK
jgi:transcriptional regulator with GAF, ATPase, and Fis domain